MRLRRAVRPMDVDALFDEPTVALRGPWNRFDLVEIGPSADDLVDLFEYHLDFPGDALDPGCSYELWARRVTAERARAVYAHVAPEEGRLGQGRTPVLVLLRVQRLEQPARRRLGERPAHLRRRGRARGARRGRRVAIGYSQHEGSERGEVGRREARARRRDETRSSIPRPGRTRTSSTKGCIWAARPSREWAGTTARTARRAQPRVVTIPSDSGTPEAYPSIAFEGRWGELQDAFFNGPTRPNLKESWHGADQLVRGVARPELRRALPVESSAPMRRTSSAKSSRPGSGR